MAGEGSIQPLLNNNKNLLRKKSFFKKDKSASKLKSALLKNHKGELQFKKISDKELEQIKSEIKSRAKNNHLKNTLYLLLTLVSACIIMAVYTNNIIKTDKKYQLQKERTLLLEQTLKKEKLYTIYIEEGDIQFKNKHWKNAIHFYKKALSLKPEDSLANIQLIKSETQFKALTPQ